MLDPAQNIPEVSAAEILARFIYSSRHFTADGEVKQDAYIPPPTRDLSMTRHLHATEAELWNDGNRIASERQRTLYGRADLQSEVFWKQGLETKPDPIIPTNPNHVVAVGWSVDKRAQKLIALELAAQAKSESAPSA